MIRAWILISGLCFCLVAKGQLYDAQWILGYNTSVVDFRTFDTIKTYSIPTNNYFSITNASICNPNGNLLFYTNGISICTENDTLPNGSGLSPSSYTTSYDCCGLNIPQAALFIPKPGNSRFYYLFHFTNDSLSLGRPGTLYYTLLDTSGNNGIGQVVEKNIPLLQGIALREGGMTACKHANGRDYWLVVGVFNTNIFYKYLITPEGISGPFIQQIGPVFIRPYDAAYSKFSQDGSKFATGIAAGPIVIMDFDRCSGDFSNPIRIYHNCAVDSNTFINGCVSVEFSPNGQYLYVSNSNDLTQYDLLASNIQDSTELYISDSTDQYGIDKLQLAENGKLYGCTWNGGLYALHVVNYPDNDGDSVDFVYGGQPTLTLSSYNLPNLINYKLGPLTGSGCDTLPNAIPYLGKADALIRIMPNPADKYAYVEVGYQGNYTFQLLNEAGQLVATKQTRQVDIFDTEALAAGVYFVRVVDGGTGAEVITKKLIVVH